MHYGSVGKIATAELYLWRQNTQYFSVFRLKVHNMWCYFYGLGHKTMTGFFCLEVAIGPLAVTRLQ